MSFANIVSIIGTFVAIAVAIGTMITYIHTQQPDRKHIVQVSVGIGIALVCVIVLAGGIDYLSISQNRDRPKTTSNGSPSGTILAQTQNTATANANMQATATAIAQNNAQATASVIAANPDPYSFGGRIRLIDPLRDNSRGAGWDEGSTDVGTRSFNNGSYYVASPRPGYFNDGFERNIIFQNFVAEVQMTIVQGDCGGILFRANPDVSEFYNWTVCQNGMWDLYAYFSRSNGEAPIEYGTFSPLNINTLAVAASGSQIALYINGLQVREFTNTSFGAGNIGLIANNLKDSTLVAYNNLRVWTMS